ncbi:helix-turn-helix domain-containing protein [Paraburkholderia strydomiana]|uniref:helix-turn-helix domain-containing protein n=1 Tax=Paraburkholderia strydomiana TaxID=1245417 RepID=UPI0038B904F1
MDRFDIWDGERPLSPRVVVARSHLAVDGISATLATENIQSPTDWCFEGSTHTVVVHLAGRLTRMESVFSKGPSTDALPAIGDIWAIPAGCRYAALAHGDEAGFAEFTLPAGGAGQGEFTARVGHRDPFLYHAAAKLTEWVQREGDLAAMARDSLLQVVRFHLLDRYLPLTNESGKVSATRLREFSNRERKLLDEHLKDSVAYPLTVSELASLLKMSETSFLRVFKSSFGTTPWQYIMRSRLESGMNLLANSGKSITEIAAATGFSSPSHFSTAFARQFNVSPSAYRKRRSN